MGNVEKVDWAADNLFVLPSRRGLNPEDPGFDPQYFLDEPCEEAMSIQREKLRAGMRNWSVCSAMGWVGALMWRASDTMFPW
jgi:hypothetical protein